MYKIIRNIAIGSLCLISILVQASVCDDHKLCRYRFYNKHSFLTYFSTHDLHKNNSKVERLVIVIHGALRNGDEYFNDTVKAAKKFGVADKTIILSPSFRKISDERGPTELYWGRPWDTKWKYGYRSQDQDKVSSFKVIDNLIYSIARSNNFPNLKNIVITGHSAGGQFTQRYAVYSEIRNHISQKILFVPSNPSSYLYLDPERYEFSGGNYRLKSFDQNNCKDFNAYIYGPEQLPDFFYRGIDQLRKNYEKNNVIYLMSEEDKDTDSLDQSCEANLQGLTRFERAKNYWFYLKNHLSTLNHKFVSIPEIGHDHIAVYSSEEAKEVIFGQKINLSTDLLFNKIGKNNDVIAVTSSHFTLFGGGKNEPQGFKRFLSSANGGDILVISAKDVLNHRYTHDLWNIAEENQIQINSVQTISLLSRNVSENDFIIARIANAEAIFFTGGNQAKYIARIKGTLVHKALLEKVKAGTPIAGTSAGLAIMGEFIFSARHGGLSSDYVYKNPHAKEITIERDFFYSPLLKDLITDTHFSERNREARLLGFMFRSQFDYNLQYIFGLGIDEKSSLTIVKQGMIATGGVWLYKSTGGFVQQQTGQLNYSYIKQKLETEINLPHFSKL